MKIRTVMVLAGCLAYGVPVVTATARAADQSSGETQEKHGTAKGAAAGALAGHEMGSGHAVAGAAAGAAIGHHEQKKANGG
jgi:hypothetical protein